MKEIKAKSINKKFDKDRQIRLVRLTINKENSRKRASTAILKAASHKDFKSRKNIFGKPLETTNKSIEKINCLQDMKLGQFTE